MIKRIPPVDELCGLENPSYAIYLAPGQSSLVNQYRRLKLGSLAIDALDNHWLDFADGIVAAASPALVNMAQARYVSGTEY